MTFLTPIPMIIAAAIGVPVLLLLYFLRLRRASLRVGSTLLWDAAAKDLEVNVPWRMIRPSWLLILQLLGLLGLCAALGRPALNTPGSAATRVVILIDRSASMNAVDTLPRQPNEPARSRLDDAKARAIELAQTAWRSGGDSRVSVVTFAQSAAVLAPWTRDRTTLSETIEAITPSDQPGSLRAAMDALASLAMENVATEAAASSVTAYILSDGSFADTTPPAVPPGVDLRYLRLGPAIEQIGTNRGIVSAQARRDFDDPATVRVTLRVITTDATPGSQPIRATLAGKPVGTVNVALPPATRTAESLTPGEAVATFAIPDRTGGLLSLDLTGADALASDDRVEMTLDAAATPRVLLVGPGPRGADASPFLLNYLSVAAANSHEVIGRAELDVRLAASQSLKDVDLIILDRVDLPSLPPVPTLSFGGSIPGVALVRPPDASQRQRAVTWQRTHPVMRDVDLSTIEFTGPRTIADSPLVAAGTTLTEGVAGPLISAVTTGAVRRVVASPDVTRTTWGPDLSFVIFLSNAIDWLTLQGQGRAGRWAVTGGPTSVLVEPGVRQIELRPPMGMPVVIDVPPPALGNEGQPQEVSLGTLERVGTYAVSGVRTGQSPLAANLLDATESAIATRATLAVGQRSAVASLPGISPPREIWTWFVLAAIGLLTLEWLLFAIRSRL